MLYFPLFICSRIKSISGNDSFARASTSAWPLGGQQKFPLICSAGLSWASLFWGERGRVLLPNKRLLSQLRVETEGLQRFPVGHQLDVNQRRNFLRLRSDREQLCTKPQRLPSPYCFAGIIDTLLHSSDLESVLVWRQSFKRFAPAGGAAAEMEWRQQSSVSCADAFAEARRWIEVRAASFSLPSLSLRPNGLTRVRVSRTAARVARSREVLLLLHFHSAALFVQVQLSLARDN